MTKTAEQKYLVEQYKKRIADIEKKVAKKWGEIRIFIDKELSYLYQKSGGVEKINYQSKEVVKYIDDLQKAVAKKIDNVNLLLQEQAVNECIVSYYQNNWAINSLAKSNEIYQVINSTIIKEVLDYPLSYLTDSVYLRDKPKIMVDRIKKQIYASIISGDDYPTLARKLNKLVGVEIKGTIAKLQGYSAETMRVARTELKRVYQGASRKLMYEAQAKGVEERLQLISTIDGRTRQQSIIVNGEISTKDGKFKYPNGRYYYASETGKAEWDINDREVSTPYYKGVKGNDDIGDYESWAKANNITKDKELIESIISDIKQT